VRRRIFGPQREEVAGDWRKMHNEELHNFYSSPNIIVVIKSRTIKWTGLVACMECMKNTCTVLVGNAWMLPLRIIEVEGRIILIWFLNA
jgi:hypothetical protein